MSCDHSIPTLTVEKKMKRVFPGVSENLYRGSFPYNTRKLLWLGAIWTFQLNWSQNWKFQRCMHEIKIKKKQNKKNTIPPFPTKQRVHKVPLHLWSVGKSTNTQFIKILDTNMFYTTYFRGQWFLHVPFSCLESLWHFSQLCRGRVECRELEIGESSPKTKNKTQHQEKTLKNMQLFYYFFKYILTKWEIFIVFCCIFMNVMNQFHIG